MAVTIYSGPNFNGGQSLFSKVSEPNLKYWDMNDKTSSIEVTGSSATFYEDIDYRGRSWTLPPGQYDLRELAALRIPRNTISSFVV
jgi:Beta/Gamma crystallin